MWKKESWFILPIIFSLSFLFARQIEAQLPEISIPALPSISIPDINVPDVQINTTPPPTSTETTTHTTSTTTNSQTTNSTYVSEKNTSEKITSEKDSSSTIPQQNTQSTNPRVAAPQNKVLLLNRINTTNRRIVLTSDIDEVIFGPGSLLPNQPPLTIVMPSERDLSIRFNFEAYLDRFQTVTLPQAIRMEQTSSEDNVEVLLPANVQITAPDCQDTWDGTFTGLSLLSPSGVSVSGKHIEVPLQIGRSDCHIVLSKPASFLFKNQADSQIGYRLHTNDHFTEINSSCPIENQPECFTKEGKNLLVSTNHFTQFITLRDATFLDFINSLFKNNTWIAILVAAIIIILLLFVLSNFSVLRKIGKLDQRNQEQKDYLSIATHELRTPMTAIKWWLSMILHGQYGKLNKSLKTSLEKVNDSTEHSLHLVNDILDASRLESGKTALSLTSFPIDTVITSVVETLQSIAKEKKLTLEAKEIESVSVHADKDKVRQILTNLVGNALKCTDTGSVTVDLKKLKDHVVISVHDTGVGIAENEKEKLFKKFEKLSNMEGKKVASSGLGLYISRQLAHRMGGNVELVKSSPGNGSTFALSLLQADSPLVKKVEKDTP